MELMLCGGVAGAISSAVTYPLDLARSRLAVTLDSHPDVSVRSHVHYQILI